MIIRFLSVIFGGLALYLLQTSVFPSVALAGVVPNLLLILVCSVGFMRGRIRAMFTGLFCGLIVDCCFGNLIGIFALIYMTIGYFSGYTNKIYDQDDYTLPLVLTAAGELTYNLLYYFIFFLLKGDLRIGYYMYRVMIPRIVYTVLISIVLYKLINVCNVFFMRFDREDD